MDAAKLIADAQAYDLKHRPPSQNWARVPDEQVLRLLTGAGTMAAQVRIPAPRARGPKIIPVKPHTGHW